MAVVSISGAGNHLPTRRRLLWLSTIVGPCACFAFLLVSADTSLWLVAPLLTIIGNVAFGVAMVALNAYLPTLAADQLKARSSHAVTALDDDLALPSSTSVKNPLPVAVAAVSAKGIAAGYTSGILLLAVLLVPVTLMHGSLLSFRWAIACSGAWWLIFGLRQCRRDRIYSHTKPFLF